jgi:hypothetical protein
MAVVTWNAKNPSSQRTIRTAAIKPSMFHLLPSETEQRLHFFRLDHMPGEGGKMF